MSFARLNVFLDEIKKVIELETGEKEEKPLEGDAGFKVAKQLFGTKKEKR